MSHTPLRRILAVLSLALAVALIAPARAESQPPEDASDASIDTLASQLQGKTGFGLSSLQLSGFGDFTYGQYLFSREAGVDNKFGKDASFYVGNLNLYLDAQLSERARSLIEVRFSYLPNGKGERDGANYDRTNWAAGDYNEGDRSVNLGSIIIQRAWVEYRFDELFTLRAGHFLTPYGIWVVDHGSPVIAGAQRPFVIKEQFIPESQVGLEGYGTVNAGPLLIGYHLTVSNGRIGTNPEYMSLNGKPGLGARVFVESNGLGTLRVGASGYTGRFTDPYWVYVDDSGLPAPVGGSPTKQITQRYDESAAAVDVHWDFQSFLVNTEYIFQKVHYTAGNPLRADRTPVEHDRRHGVYVLAGYRLPFNDKLMPFAMYEFFRRSDELRHEGGRNNDIYKYTAGLNYHLQPNLVIKAQGALVERHGKNVNHQGDDSWEYFIQTAWAF